MWKMLEFFLVVMKFCNDAYKLSNYFKKSEDCTSVPGSRN